MIHHHDQAITMTGWVPDRTSNTSIRLLAKRMEVSQTDEVAFLRTWLETRGEDPNSQHDEHAPSMPGMLTQEQLDALENAKGKAFDKLFLAYMTQHHEGAIQMVAELYGERRRDRARAQPVRPARGLRPVDRDQAHGPAGRKALICNT